MKNLPPVRYDHAANRIIFRLGRMVCLLDGLALLTLLSGCVVAGVIDGVGTVAVATVKTTGRVVGATAATVGHAAGSAVPASDAAPSPDIQAAVKLSKEGAIIFFDPASGAVWEAPWRKGLTLQAASDTAKVETVFHAVKIIRKAKEVPGGAADTERPLNPGDVVELVRHPVI
jgi:hypothetical protein